MHKYFARRPWNVFNELISHYSSPAEIVLDSFCGGGVTIVEALKLGRKAVGVDLNPIATYVTEMECKPVRVEALHDNFHELRDAVGKKISSLYTTKCPSCRSPAIADWFEWDEHTGEILRLKVDCTNCGSSKTTPATREDAQLAKKITNGFDEIIDKDKLWFPRTRIPPGDKTNSLLNQEINFYSQLFTKRNLLALSYLHREIGRLADREAGDFLQFAFSGSLKWASRQSHLRGHIVEGWAMHAYWIYPRSLEINVWNTFERRLKATVRGKTYSNEHIGHFCKFAQNFSDLTNHSATCFILNRSATKLPIPDNSIDAVITDPPYGGNVNYAELSDYWYIWLSEGKTIPKRDEVIVNKTQRKTLKDYGELLSAVFKECYRVLKPHRFLVSTFNSRDLRVVASFVTAASEAGFTLHPEGLLYQPPIRPYTTTFHAMQIGAFVGDFIFTFVKEAMPPSTPAEEDYELQDLKAKLGGLIDETVKGGITEPQLRERAYRVLIPFLAKHAQSNTAATTEAVDFFENKMNKQDLFFRRLRRKITKTRIQAFSGKR
jgi:16S rRNA G966 N2-methylase RsmD